MSTKISIVIPCFNEAEVLPLLFQRLNELPGLPDTELDFVLVDDGSTDNTWQQIRAFAEQNKCSKALRLSRNFGHQRALWAGLQAAQGDAVMVIDADLQDPPELLDEFVEKWRQGNQVVYGVRQKRKEGLIKRMAYKSFYRILGKLSDIRIPLDSGDFCLMDRCIVDQLLEFNEPSPFIRGARAWVGYDQVPLEYERDARAAGKEKYGLKQLVDLAINGLLSYTQKPVRFLMVTGALLFAAAGVFGFAAGVLLLSGSSVFGLPVSTVLLSVLIGMVGGCNLMGLGVVGEYVAKTLECMKSRPTAVVAEVAEGDARSSGTVVYSPTESSRKLDRQLENELPTDIQTETRRKAA